MLDPLVTSIISISFGLMFLLASVHKLTGFSQFRAVLDDYRVMPGVLVPLAAAVLPLLEVLLGLGWLFLADVRIAAFGTIGLVTLYTSAIAINLLRGRVHISCGCGFGKAAGGDESLSRGLVVRNVVLLAAAAAATVPGTSRTLGVFDYATLVVAVLAIVLLFTAANQLIRNAGAINTWRQEVRPRD